jgi:hypothetical protein
VSSPEKAHRTGVDGLLRESEPDGFTEARTSPSSISVLTVVQPLSFEEQCENTEKQLLMVLALFRSQLPHMTPEWYAKFCDSADSLFKFVDDTIRDETRRTLPKTNERDHQRCQEH